MSVPKRYRAISVFSGCGGSDLGLKNAGVDVFWASDISDAATEVYKLNFPETEVVCEDIRKITDFPAADILVGCYPCQGFSQGGKREPDAAINKLYLEFRRALSIVKPKAFIIENVIGMSYGRNVEILERQLRAFRTRGYKVRWKALDARDFGLAQERKRIFLVGIRSDLRGSFDFPAATHGSNNMPPRLSQRDILKSFKEWPEGEFDDQPLSWYYMSRRRRRGWDEAAPCVVANSRQIALHPISPEMEYAGPDKYIFKTEGRARRYSFRECAALQGFPESFNWGLRSVREKYRLIGNAVPPPLFEAVARKLVEQLAALD